MHGRCKFIQYRKKSCSWKKSKPGSKSCQRFGKKMNILRGIYLAIIFLLASRLLEILLKKKLPLVETIRKNKPELPPQFTVAKGRDITSTIFGFQNDATIASYCPKKDCVVNMRSTMHSFAEIASNSAEKKPKVILYYNSTKSGVDILG